MNKFDSIRSILIIILLVVLWMNVASAQNTWTTATVKNDFGVKIYNVKIQHRYDNDHYDNKSWNVLDDGQQGESFPVGYWTGFGRTGKDYWFITFEAEGKLWSCKDNFYCFLRSSDTRGTVICRVYKENGQAKMDVDCPQSGDCTVSLENGGSNPNSWTTAVIKNNWGAELKNIRVNHRYDNDHFDTQFYSHLQQGETSSSFRVGFWTGFGRTGKDYWDIEFEVDGKRWSCKDNFYCYLTSDDVNKNVEVRLFKDGNDGKMVIDCPISSDCIVALESKPMINPENGRPFYLIGHRCNDAEDIGIALSGGCNAIECDLQFDKNTNEVFVNHDNASGLTLSKWLNNAKLLTEQYNENFSLIIFDCKFVTENYPERSRMILKQVMEKIRGTLTNSPNPVNVIFSIASYDNRDAFNEITADLRLNEGISIDECDEPEKVEAYFKSINVQNSWYGNGISTMWEDPEIYQSLQKASALRDSNRHFKKTYVWTLASENTIERFIEEIQVDGVFVNVPGTIDGIAPTGLKEALNVISKSYKIRMAKRSDKTFSVFEK